MPAPTPHSAQLRFLKQLGESSFWKRTGRIHTWIYRATGGRVGQAAGHIQNLLLTTRGRRSGTERTVPLAYLADGATFVIVASNGGADRHPAWFLNLKAEPRARVQIGRETYGVIAHEASAEERARLWPRLKEWNPFYARYELITARQIPVVVLEPATR